MAIALSPESVTNHLRQSADELKDWANSEYAKAYAEAFRESVEDQLTGESIRLLRDEVLVRIEKPERMTISKLLFIPETAKRPEEEVYNGVVVATGPGARSNRTGAITPCDVKPGDRVFMYWHGVEGSSKCRWPDENHVILQESQIRGVYE